MKSTFFLSESETLLGSELPAEDQRFVLSAYVHRFTRQHRPLWASGDWKDDLGYPVQFDSDADGWHTHASPSSNPAG